MADTKFLDSNGLSHLVDKINEKFIDTEEVRAPIKWDSTNEELYLDITDKLTVPSTGDNIGKLDIDLSKVAGETMLVDNTNGGIVLDVGTGLKTETDSGNTGKKKVSVDLDNITGNTLSVTNNTIDVDLEEIAGSGITVVNNKLTAASQYELPAATSSVLGGVKVGDGLEMIESTASSGVYDKMKAKVDGTTVTINNNGALKVVDGKYPELDANGKIDPLNLPSYVDDVIEGYAKTTTTGEPPVTTITFWKNRSGSGTELDPYVYTNEITGETGKIYLDLGSGDRTYRYSGSTFVEITSGAYDIISDAEIDALFA